MIVEFIDLAVFTRDGTGGNPLAVVEAGTVPSSSWQATATAIGYSETVFLERDEPATVHIYTPWRRLPFAGHPLVGTAFALGDAAHTLKYDAGSARISRLGDEVAVTVSADGDVRDAAVPLGVGARVVEMPLPYLVVEMGSVDAVAAVTPEQMAAFDMVYVWAWDKPGEVIRSRFFATGAGVAEDAATGSAAVALACSLPQDRGSLTIHQGEEMGRPSRITLSWEGRSVTIGGVVEDLGTGTVAID